MVVRLKTGSSYDDPVPLDLVKRRRFFHDEPLALEAALLLSKATFQHGVSGEYLDCVETDTWRMLDKKLTTSYFSNSLVSLTRDEPCHTKTFIPSVWVLISFRHCIIATVGLENIIITQRKKNPKVQTYATTRFGRFRSDTKSEII